MKKLKLALLFLSLVAVSQAQVTNPTASVSISGTVNVAGVKSNNGGAPGATNLGTLPAVANAAAPSYTEARQVALSTDLAGTLRVGGAVTITSGSVTVVGAAANGAALSGNPVPVAFSDGANNFIPQVCDKQAFVNLTDNSLTQVIALSGSTTIRVCHISFAAPAPADVKLRYGTGSNCGSGTTDLSALWKSVQSFDFTFPLGSPLKGVASNALCIIQTTSQAAGVMVVYGQN